MSKDDTEKYSFLEKINSTRVLVVFLCLLIIVLNTPLGLAVPEAVLQILAYSPLGYIGFETWGKSKKYFTTNGNSLTGQNNNDQVEV